MIVETEQDGTLHLDVGGYDWWWMPGQRRVADGDGSGAVTLPGAVELTVEAVSLYLLGWSDGRQGGISDGQKWGAENAREAIRKALGVMSGKSTHGRLCAIEPD